MAFASGETWCYISIQCFDKLSVPWAAPCTTGMHLGPLKHPIQKLLECSPVSESGEALYGLYLRVTPSAYFRKKGMTSFGLCFNCVPEKGDWRLRIKGAFDDTSIFSFMPSGGLCRTPPWCGLKSLHCIIHTLIFHAQSSQHSDCTDRLGCMGVGQHCYVSECLLLLCLYRGFGFVIYKDPTAVDKVLSGGPHQLDSKVVCHFFTVCFRNPLEYV